MAEVLNESEDGMGIIGSDTVRSLDDNARKKLNFQSLVATTVRYALAAPVDTAEQVNEKIVNNEPINVATSSQKLYWQAANERNWQIGKTLEIKSSVEAIPSILPVFDAVFDIVDSGATLREQETSLAIIYDDVISVSVGVIWKK